MGDGQSDKEMPPGRGGGGGVGDEKLRADLVRHGPVLNESRGAALGYAAEQLVDLEPEQRDEGLVAALGQVRAPALAAGAEDPVLVDPDDGADRRALGSFEAGESLIEVGWAEAVLGKQGPSLGAVRRIIGI